MSVKSQSQAPKQSRNFQKEQEKLMENLRTKNQIKPLTQKLFTDMLSLELLMASRKFTFSTIENLVQLYAQAIEYYDSLKDPISLYFQEKIQITLASQKSLKMILHKQTERANREEKKKTALNISIIDKEVDFSMIDTSRVDTDTMRSEVDESVEDRVGDLVQTINKKKGIHRYSIAKVRVERAKEVDRFIKVQNEKFTAIKNITTLLDEYQQSIVMNDKLVRNNIDIQHNNFKLKLERRRRKIRDIIPVSRNLDAINATTPITINNFFKDQSLPRPTIGRRKADIAMNFDNLLGSLETHEDTPTDKSNLNKKPFMHMQSNYESSSNSEYFNLQSNTSMSQSNNDSLIILGSSSTTKNIGPPIQFKVGNLPANSFKKQSTVFIQPDEVKNPEPNPKVLQKSMSSNPITKIIANPTNPTLKTNPKVNNMDVNVNSILKASPSLPISHISRAESVVENEDLTNYMIKQKLLNIKKAKKQ